VTNIQQVFRAGSALRNQARELRWIAAAPSPSESGLGNGSRRGAFNALCCHHEPGRADASSRASSS